MQSLTLLPTRGLRQAPRGTLSAFIGSLATILVLTTVGIVAAGVYLIRRRSRFKTTDGQQARSVVSPLAPEANEAQGPSVTSSFQAVTRDTRFVEYLAKLEELKSRGAISEGTYQRLKGVLEETPRAGLIESRRTAAACGEEWAHNRCGDAGTPHVPLTMISSWAPVAYSLSANNSHRSRNAPTILVFSVSLLGSGRKQRDNSETRWIGLTC